MTLLLHSKKRNCTLRPRIFQKHPLFITCLLVFTVDELCNVSNKSQPPSNLAKYQYFYKRELITLLYFENFRNTSFYHIFTTVSEVCNIPNKYWLPNKWDKIFYTKHLILLLHSNKKFVLSIAQVFKNTHFLPHVNYFSQWMRCAIFQIKTNLLVIYQDINIFTKETLYPSIIWKKNWRSRLLAFFETSTFYHIFTVFNSEVCNISNKHQLPNKSATKIFSRKIPNIAPSLQQKNCVLHRTSF